MESIMSDGKEELLTAREQRRLELQQKFNPQRMKVVRKELFANLRDPAVTIRNGNITFNTACINGLEGVVWVNLLIDDETGIFAVQECEENDKEALRWCVARPDKRKSRKMNCPDFTDLLYNIMHWDKNCRYKVLGYLIEFDGKLLYVFDLSAYKIFKERPKKGESTDGEEVQVEITPVDRRGYFPDDIANTFGVPVEEHKRKLEVTELNGLVSIGALTSAQRDKDNQGETALSERNGDGE